MIITTIISRYHYGILGWYSKKNEEGMAIQRITYLTDLNNSNMGIDPNKSGVIQRNCIRVHGDSQSQV